ncbi:MAG: DUF4136 domain-containing protein [Novosphingobium sp.]|nr:DUF4136 domain-containing protein [Novosphingobium sp.]
MKRLLAVFAIASLTVSPVVARPAPVEVTRFHNAQTLPRLKGAAVIIEALPGYDAASLEDGVWRNAVARELGAAGFGSATPGAADGIAEVRVERETMRRDRARGPVSVGVGGSTGSYGSGVGLGVGLNLGGGPRELVLTRLSVRIRDRVTGEALWEGRAESRENAKAKDAAPALAAPRLARALFAGFPGRSGETITVK